MTLTKRQRCLMDYLIGYIRTHRVSPSYEEIAAEFGYRSLSTVHEHIRKLAAKGLIRVERMRPRSIEVLQADDRSRPYPQVFPPRAWLRERADERPVCPMPDASELPVDAIRHYRERWQAIRALLLAGDELWTFRAPEELWRQASGRAGYAVVREGRVVDGVLTWDELSKPDRQP